jgi:hypothetical protein
MAMMAGRNKVNGKIAKMGFDTNSRWFAPME